MFARSALRSFSSSSRRAFSASALRAEAERSALETRLRDGLKSAMKAKDRSSVTTLKSIIADVTYFVKSGANPNEHAGQESVMNVIRKGIDKRKQAADSYAPGAPGAHEENHSALAAEIALLQSYLPDAPSGDAIQAMIDEIVKGLSDDVKSKKGAATGQVMKALWERLGDARAAVDKKDVAARVGQALK